MFSNIVLNYRPCISKSSYYNCELDRPIKYDFFYSKLSSTLAFFFCFYQFFRNSKYLDQFYFVSLG